jgi:hypothetical protein
MANGNGTQCPPTRKGFCGFAAGLAAFLVLLGMIPVRAAADRASQNEEARFDVFVDGKDIGNEKFSISISDGGIATKSTVFFQEPVKKSKKVRMETQLSMDANYLPRAYELHTDVEGEKGSVTGTFTSGEAAFEYRGKGNPVKRGLLVGNNYVILDTNVFHHFVFIARKFDFGKNGTQSIEAVIPQELDSGTLKVRETGVEMVSIKGKTMGLHHLRADSGALMIDLWVDDQKVLYKIALPAKKIEVMRNR